MRRSRRRGTVHCRPNAGGKEFDDHAPDFGVALPNGAAGYRALTEALRKFQAAPANATITGAYQRQPAMFMYDPEKAAGLVRGMLFQT